MKKVIIIGGGAAGFFTAINIKELNPKLDVTILEKGKDVLQKVKISGGGRCNVTHACFEPKELIKNYPRGKKELLGPFHQFMTGDTFEWFDNRGVPLKIENDNRVFPEANTSQAIISCFTELTNKLNIKVTTSQNVIDIEHQNHSWKVITKNKNHQCDFLVIASGSGKKIWDLVKKLDHKIITPVPSLFTFNIKDPRIIDLGGVSVPNAIVKIAKTKLENSGPLLITHWGLSGPAVLKLSAYGARILSEKNYQYNVIVNWLGMDSDVVLEMLNNFKKKLSKKHIYLRSPFSNLPKRLWERLLNATKISPNANWADLSNKQLNSLSIQLTQGLFNANGRTTFKDEFVTAGGIDLKEIDFKRFESKIHKNLFIVGEALNIDAVTGGFNFQNAWTSVYICAKSIAENPSL